MKNQAHGCSGTRSLRRALSSILLLALPIGAYAQDAAPAQPHAHAATPAAGWLWGGDTRLFFGFNDQERKFTDFAVWESQNWVMGSGRRSWGATRLELAAMLSFEPFTIEDIGSPQVFQTGETFQNAPLIDYQHPHDLIMQFGGDLYGQAGSTTAFIGAWVVGTPPLGPPPFMHRPSAAETPTAPLSHHNMDSTHITHGLIRGGLERAGWAVEAGVFQGREPDEDRLDLDLGALDSFAMRVSWTRGPWSAQFSGAQLTLPERTSPYDSSRITASVSYFSGVEGRSLAWMGAFGQNREFHGKFEAYLLEGTWRTSRRNAFYARLEHVQKDILDAGFHPIGTPHVHRPSPIGAFTGGYVRELFTGRFGSLGLGGDVTGHTVAANLKESYGSPVSFHVFLRYRGRAGPAMPHVH
jgi:hypothetical protein